MCDVLCVTSRQLCEEPFLARVERLAQAVPRLAGLVLREKDLSVEAYRELAVEVLSRCRRFGVRCLLHGHAELAVELGADGVHLPLALLRELPEAIRVRLGELGASCHSVAEVREATERGCTYVTAGHIFATDCKRGLPGRGVEFLRQACAATSLPVYAIGGMTPERTPGVLAAGARGVCVMSSLMQCEEPERLLAAFAGER